MWAWLALMELAPPPTVKNTPSGVCPSSPVAGIASTTRGARTVQSLTIVTEWRINMRTEKKNLRRISIVVTAQTKGNLERLAAVCGYSEIGRVVDKLTHEKMISLHDFERKEK